MRPDVLVGPSEWVVEQFGDRVAGELWTRVPEALSTAIDREVNTHPAMTQTMERVLANPRWPLPYEELVLFLGALPGAEIISVPKSVYQLVVINGHVVVPWCYGQSAQVSMRDARSGARSAGSPGSCCAASVRPGGGPRPRRPSRWTPSTSERLPRSARPSRRSRRSPRSSSPGLPGRRISDCCGPA